MKKAVVICIIDDDDIYKFVITKMIEVQKLAKKILVFSDGEEAMQFMIDNVANSTELPDVIFLDINMPIMDGFQFMEEYIKLKPKVGKKITIYMITSSIDPVDVEKAKRLSEISDYLIKPIHQDQVKAIIETIEKLND